MTPRTCKFGGCDLPVPYELLDHELCLEHFLAEVVDRIRAYARQLADEESDRLLQQTVLQFIVFTAARLANIGTNNPPHDQLARGRLLNAMLMLADLRERLDKAAEAASR